MQPEVDVITTTAAAVAAATAVVWKKKQIISRTLSKCKIKSGQFDPNKLTVTMSAVVKVEVAAAAATVAVCVFNSESKIHVRKDLDFQTKNS
jgi:nucleoside phosphorylase